MNQKILNEKFLLSGQRPILFFRGEPCPWQGVGTKWFWELFQPKPFYDSIIYLFFLWGSLWELLPRDPSSLGWATSVCDCPSWLFWNTTAEVCNPEKKKPGGTVVSHCIYFCMVKWETLNKHISWSSWRSCLTDPISSYDQVTHLVDEGKAVELVYLQQSLWHCVPQYSGEAGRPWLGQSLVHGFGTLFAE